MKTDGNIDKRLHYFHFHIFFIGSESGMVFLETKNDAGIPVISKTEIYGREHIDNGRNPSKRYLKNDKHIKQSSITLTI